MTRPHGMPAAEIAEWRKRWGEGPHVTVDLVVFTLRPPSVLSVLLVRRGIPPYEGEWAIPGGFLKKEEGLAEAARRELAEETGVTDLGDAQVDQLATYGDPKRDPRGRVVSVIHLALVPFHLVSVVEGGDDAAEARYFDIVDGRPVDPQGRPVKLAFDHAEAVHAAVDRLRARVTYTTAPFALMPEEFTLAELQGAYEAILGVALHRRAFRERVEREGWVVETKRFRTGSHRPARLFRAATRELLWMRPWPESAKVAGGLPTERTKRFPPKRKSARS